MRKNFSWLLVLLIFLVMLSHGNKAFAQEEFLTSYHDSDVPTTLLWEDASTEEIEAMAAALYQQYLLDIKAVQKKMATRANRYKKIRVRIHLPPLRVRFLTQADFPLIEPLQRNWPKSIYGVTNLTPTDTFDPSCCPLGIAGLELFRW